MPISLSRALAALSGIYKFPGVQSAPEAVEVGLPLQLVHDVSREAELASGFFVNANVVLGPTAGAGAVVHASTTRAAFLASANPAALLQQNGLVPQNVDVWVYGWWAVIAAADAGDFGHFRLGIALGTPIGGALSRVLTVYTVVDAQPIIAAGTRMLSASFGTNSPSDETQFGQLKVPIFLPDDVESAFLAEGADDAGGDMTCTAFFRCWVGPKGSPPPAC